MVSLFSLPNWHLVGLQPSSPVASGPAGSGAHYPWGFGYGLGGPPLHCRSTMQLGGEEAGVAAAGEFPKQLPSVSFFTFSFLEIPPAQACCFKQGRASPLTQSTSPTRPGTVRIRAHHGPTLPSRHTQFPWVLTASVCLPLHPYSPPCDFKQPGLSRCCSNLVWQGRELLTWLSPKSSAADPAGAGPEAAATLVPAVVPGTLLS